MPDTCAGSDSPLMVVPALRAIGTAERERLARVARVVDIATPTEIFSQGDASDAVYAIVGGDGGVRIGAVDRQSKALMVEVLKLGDIFGEVGVIEGKPRTAFAVTEGHVRLLRIGAAGFREILASSPTLGEALCRILAGRLRRTFELFQDATFESLEVRLARQILYLAAVAGRVDSTGVRLGRRVRQGDLADLLGATNRSIITILNTWRSRGIVTYNTTSAMLTLTDAAALKALLPSLQDERHKT